MKWLWISGWSVPPEWLAGLARATWPAAAHTAVAPHAAEAALRAGGYDIIAGYSIGALWLLCRAGEIPAGVPVALFAPTFAFPAEAGRGGRIPLAQLRLTRKRLRLDALAAVGEFAQVAGLAELGIPAPPNEFSPENVARLDEGLDWLENWSAPAPPPANWRGWMGDADPLLDAAVTAQQWPALTIVAGAGHAPGPLLAAAATVFPNPP